MKIRLLGTGAADGIPGFYSQDEVSRYAREVRGKELRTRAAAIVDDVLKIDLPPDTYMQLLRDGLDPRDWSGLIFTHSHEDHCAVSEIQYALYPFVSSDNLSFTIFGNSAVVKLIRIRYPEWPMDLVTTESFVPFSHGSYKITPVKANHIEGEDCHNLLIERNGTRLLYATDTGVWSEKTIEFLAQTELDALIIECTDGFHPSGYSGHLSIETCLEAVNLLRNIGTLKADSRVFTTHHSHQGKARHCDLESALCKHDIQPGYDGMVIEI